MVWGVERAGWYPEGPPSPVISHNLQALASCYQPLPLFPGPQGPLEQSSWVGVRVECGALCHGRPCPFTGVSAPSFLHCFSLASAAFNLQVATPGGKAMDFVDMDESSARWVQDFRLRSYASPAKLESIDEPICAVGHGVAALCCATSEDGAWAFQNYSMTGPSVYELIRAPGFARLPLIVEDFAKDAGASFSASEPGAVHVVLDRHLVTGQNANSTVVAVQNLLFLCSSRK
ncbi:glutamine amidotransferase-like class 1 domain-containing protein 1 isoform X2 [Echinops telfairi]|uniref:Glutamine amidotransferase-like class 1 domain-containing protein 1 n=1 Tax=Echinops telfairi TaxID=9371 RepID=A0ABM1VJZ2_ECHTE|nr:glutamine amidotransferase-like class 1 domain-containing protein 1 isoform X2 [Echinops telfairi]